METYNKLWLVLLIIISFNYTNSQTGPGGIGTNDGTSALRFWYIADNEAYTNGASVNSVSDLSGYNNTLSATGAEQPTFSLADVNNMSSFSFDGSNELETAYQGNSNENMSFGLVFNSPSSSSGVDIAIQHGGRNTISFADTDAKLSCFVGGTNNTSANSTAFNTWLIHSRTYANSGTDRLNHYINNNLTDTFTHNIENKTSNTWIGGNGSGGGNKFTGAIAEVYKFTKVLSDAERIIIDNYLSAKYGTTLDANDLYTHDNAGAGNFDHNVAGIGQADDGSNHTDSQGTGIVRLNNPRDLDDGEFLFWGEEDKTPDYSFSQNTVTYTQQLNSTWRARRAGGNVGRVDISFDITNFDLTNFDASCQTLQLVIDNNNDFSLTDGNDEIIDLAITGNIASAESVLFRNNRYFTIRYVDEIVWDGTHFFNGSGAVNTPNDTDDSCLKLTIMAGGSPTLNNNAHVREVEIEVGANLNVIDGVLLEVEDDMTIYGTLDLNGEAQLIQNHTGPTTNSGSGVLIKRQQGTNNLYNYNYWSSPVNTGGLWQIGNLEDVDGVINFHTNPDADSSTTPITLSSRWLYQFNGTEEDYSQWSALTTTSNIAPGIGYTMKGSDAASEQEYLFKGIPNDGDYTIPALAGNEILIGNPYPSALDADQFITDNSGVIDGSLYFWEHFTSNSSHYLVDYEGGYAIRNLMMGTAAVADASGLTSGIGTGSGNLPSQYIPIGQGFFVNIDTGGDIEFNNAQRIFARESLNESVFFKNTNSKTAKSNTISNDTRPKIWFSFTIPGDIVKQFGLGYDANATKNYDKAYDALAYDALRNDVNWVINHQDATIQALPSINITDELPIKINISDSGLYKFNIDKMENVPNNLNIFLKDSDTNTYYDLKNDTAELFLNSNTYENQYAIVFQDNNTLGIEEIINDEKLSIFYNETTKNLIFTDNATKDIQSLVIYNTIGQQVLSIENLEVNRINISKFNDGVYIIKATTKNSKQLKTKILKY